MDKNQQRIAIAEACGWGMVEGIRAFPPIELVKEALGAEIFAQIGCIDRMTIPDYLDDLNSMHEAEKVLSDFQFDNYCRWIIEICGRENPFGAIKSTASQRAEAFLKTIGKWTQ